MRRAVSSGRRGVVSSSSGARTARGFAPRPATPHAEALEAQKRKRLELDAKESGRELGGLDKEDESLLLAKAVESFLKKLKTFRKRLKHQKYEYVLELFAEYAAPKTDARDIAPEDIKKFLAWRKSKGFDPGTTLWLVFRTLEQNSAKKEVLIPTRLTDSITPFFARLMLRRQKRGLNVPKRCFDHDASKMPSSPAAEPLADRPCAASPPSLR
jgi:hypothetical protein